MCNCTNNRKLSIKWVRTFNISREWWHHRSLKTLHSRASLCVAVVCKWLRCSSLFPPFKTRQMQAKYHDAKGIRKHTRCRWEWVGGWGRERMRTSRGAILREREGGRETGMTVEETGYDCVIFAVGLRGRVLITACKDANLVKLSAVEPRAVFQRPSPGPPGPRTGGSIRARSRKRQSSVSLGRAP